MRPSTIWYTLKQGIKNIKRNFMFSIASIITMAACIFLFGIFFSIVNNVNTLAHKVEEDVPITVLFNEGTTQEQMDAVGELIRQRPEVSKIEFESGDEAWEKMKQEYFGDDSEAADGQFLLLSGYGKIFPQDIKCSYCIGIISYSVGYIYAPFFSV